MPPFTSLARQLLRTAKRSQLYPCSAAASSLTHLFSGDHPRLAGGLPRLPTPACHLLPCRSGDAEFGFPSPGGLRYLSLYRSKPEPEKERAESPLGEESASGRSPAFELDGFWNLPNSISFARLASGPLLGCMIMNEWYLASFFGLAVAGISDWLDGFVARKMGINSVVGSYLDPLADKVLICCVAVSMVERSLLHPGLVLLVVSRDVGLVGAAVYKRACDLGWQWKSWFEFVNLNRFRPEKVEPLFISKVNTVLQLALVAAALLQPVFGTEETHFFVSSLSWLVASTTVISTLAYGVHHKRKAYVLSAKS